MNLGDVTVEAVLSEDGKRLKCAKATCRRRIGFIVPVHDYSVSPPKLIGLGVNLDEAWGKVESTDDQVWRVTDRAVKQERYLAQNPHARRHVPDVTVRSHPDTIPRASASRRYSDGHIGAVPSAFPSWDTVHDAYLMICSCKLQQKIVISSLSLPADQAQPLTPEMLEQIKEINARADRHH